MTQNEVDIIKNAVLDATEAYVDARLGTAAFVKTQIGVVTSSYRDNTSKKWIHSVKCNTTSNTSGIVYNNVLSVNNIRFGNGKVVFLVAPNAQFSNQFIPGQLDVTPFDLVGGSISIGGSDPYTNPNFHVNSNGAVTIKYGSLNINEKFIVDTEGKLTSTSGTIGGFEITDHRLGSPLTSSGCGMTTVSDHGVHLYAYYSSYNCRMYQGKITCSTGSQNGNGIWVYSGADENGNYILHGHTSVYSNIYGDCAWQGSDKRYKKNIKDLDFNLSKDLILSLKPKEYEFKSEKGKRYGFVAQDVREILNNIGCKDSRLEYKSNESDMHQLNYTDLIAPLTLCIQDLYKQIDVLKADMESNK